MMIMRSSLAVLLCVCVCGAATAGAGGRQILTEAAVWRTHVTWGQMMCGGSGGVKPAKYRRQLKVETPPPPGEWTKPEFDDGSWGFWREVHAVETLKGSDVRLYDTWQYGAQQAMFMRRRCLRGKFRVTNPAGVKKLTLTVVYRGGVAVFLNGKEVGRGHLSGEALADPMGCAEVYPREVYFKPDGKPWGLRNGSIGGLVFKDEASLKNFNQRMRKLTVDLPVAALRAGVNVLALDIRVGPCPEEAGVQDWWNACGAAVIDMRGEGAVEPAGKRPKGVQVWTASPLFKVSPFGSVSGGRVSNGRGVLFWNFPLCWVTEAEEPDPIRMVGVRNGVFAGQVILSSSGAIKGLKADVSDLAPSSGAFRIPAAAGRIGYMTFPAEPPARLTDPGTSLLDVLYDKPPATVASLPAKPFPGMFDISKRNAAISWSDGGATVSVWVRIKVPRDAPAGEYSGALTIRAAGLKPVAVPISLKVHGYVLPDPEDFTPHVGLVHSPESLALKYNVPLWSDKHFALMEKTCAYMGELGGDVVFIPLVTDTWLGNKRTFVSWVGKGKGNTYDFSLFDRYLDLVCKYMKPKAVCLYVYHASRRGPKTAAVNTIAGGTIGTMQTPAYGPTPEAIAFWKPLISQVNGRLKKRGLDKCVTLGLTLEGGRQGGKLKPVADLFKAVWPEVKWADLAHFGGKGGGIGDVPYGYIMSVWGNESPIRSKRWGAPDLPFVLVKHYRADPVIDIRPVASRGALYWAVETAMGPTFWGRGGSTKMTQGIGPLGMDFWNFTPAEKKTRYDGSLEGRISNLSMSSFSTAALLAPGPDGPVSTARFEVFRQGLQVCEARAFIERALEGGKLSGDLAGRCRDVLKTRMEALRIVGSAEKNAQREGWAWFEAGKWQELTDALFSCASKIKP